MAQITPQENSMEKIPKDYLSKINSPIDLRKLPVTALPDVCDNVRNFMIDVITKTGGHFGAGLGIIELTVALHYVYNTPLDKLIFDVGHQGYPHKILTGRKDRLDTIRKKGGLSGFLKPTESEYDVFGAGHASTSISAGLGIAAARDIKGESFKVVPIIGDGALTGGMAFEAMNNAGFMKTDITVILNDNNISIANNVSAFSNYFNEVYSSGTVQKLRENIWKFTGRFDNLGDRIRNFASKLEDGVKAIVTPGVLFEAMGFNYFGPVNGNNVMSLVRILRKIKDVKGPLLLHIITEKGKGYGPAERDEHKFHAIGKIDKNTGASISIPSGNKVPSMYTVFGEALVELCHKDERIVGITAAMGEGTGLDELERQFPRRFFDVGIAEEHAVTFAAGIANQGLVPVCAIYSTFLQRAYDQIIHDCALQNLHVVFALDRAGIVGEDGPTHHGVLDLIYLRSVPGMIIMAPKDEQELRDMLYTAIYDVKNTPVAIRYPRGKGLGVPLKAMNSIPLAKSETLTNGEDVAIIAVGKTVINALNASEMLKTYGVRAEVINARFVKPLDGEMIQRVTNEFDKIITVEDGQINGGFGSAVLEYINEHCERKPQVHLHGIPDRFIEHGTQDELYRDLMLDSKGICRVTLDFLGIKDLEEAYTGIENAEKVQI